MANAMQYSRLDECEMFTVGNSIEVYYCREPSFTLDSPTFDASNLERTHALVGKIGGVVGAENISLTDLLERLFVALQGERWSPNGEATTLIRNKGLKHTSFSVGDVVCFKTKATNIIYRCASIGWERF